MSDRAGYGNSQSLGSGNVVILSERQEKVESDNV
jgi:hypothetical protein